VQSVIETKNLAILLDLDYDRTISQKLSQSCKHVVKHEIVDRQGFIYLTRILYHLKADNASFNLVQSTIEIKNLAILPDLNYNRTSSQKLGVPYELLVVSSKWYSPIYDLRYDCNRGQGGSPNPLFQSWIIPN